MVLTSQFPSGPPAAPGGAPAAGAPSLGPADIMRVLKQRKMLIFITFCLFYVIVVGATVGVYRFAPLWTSEAYIKLVPPPQDWGGVTEQILPKDYILHQLATEAARIEDLVVLSDVLAQPEIKETDYYRSFGDNFEGCLYDLKNRLSTTPVRDTYLIRVSISVKEKEEATRLVNTVVDRYLQRSRSLGEDEGRRKLETLKANKLEAEQELIALRDRIANKREEQDVPAMEADRAVMVDVIAVLNNTIAELKTRLADIDAQLDTIRGVSPMNLPISAEMRVIIESDPVLRYYRQQVEQIDIQIAVLEQNRIGENNRQYKEIVSQRNLFFEKEAARREELIADLRARQVESLHQERARVQRMLTEVREQLAEREYAQRDLNAAIQELNEWERDEERLVTQLEQIDTRLRESENQLDVKRQEGTLTLAMPARDAVRPSRPNFVTWLGGGFVLAAMAAAGLAFLREFTDQAIRTPIDVARHGHLSVLGCVPLLDDEEADIDEIEVATRQAPQSLVAEQFRQVRAHLTFSGPIESQRTLLITSPSPEDGKTAVAINLAVTFAQANERTLLIDCNFRRPAIRPAFHETRTEGLSNVLVGHNPFEEVVNHTELPNLDVLTSGPMPPNPAELLGSPAMRELLDHARTKYQRVILDGPPCLLISDALVVATLTDAVVMVARAVSGTKGTLRRARELLQRINARVIGAVLNGAEARPGGYFRQQYREFYEYTDEELVMRELPSGPEDASGGDRPDKT
jgi:capsular exopolysaccharide synthesis family protein